MDKLARFAFWKSLCNVNVAKPWTTEEDLFAYFKLFRPDGEGVERVFEGINRGDEVLARLMPFYEWTRDSVEHAYFIVQSPLTTTHSELLAIMSLYFEKIRQIAVEFEEKKLAALVESIQIEARQEKAPPHPAVPEPNLFYVHEMVGDWFRSLKPSPSDVILLEEAFYSLAGSYELARYLMWPIYRDATPIDDPFAPAFQLWIRGADFRFASSKQVIVYAPGLRTYESS